MWGENGQMARTGIDLKPGKEECMGSISLRKMAGKRAWEVERLSITQKNKGWRWDFCRKSLHGARFIHIPFNNLADS
jgi:hypothetical protein